MRRTRPGPALHRAGSQTQTDARMIWRAGLEDRSPGLAPRPHRGSIAGSLPSRIGSGDRRPVEYARDLAKVYVLLSEGRDASLGILCDLDVPDPVRGGLPQAFQGPAAETGDAGGPDRQAGRRTRAVQGPEAGRGPALPTPCTGSGTCPEAIGIRAIIMNAIDQRAREFYLHHEFLAFADDPDRLFLPLSMVRASRFEHDIKPVVRRSARPRPAGRQAAWRNRKRPGRFCLPYRRPSWI